MMEERSCHRCGKRLHAGGLNYVVNIRVFADFDGILLEPEEGVDQQLRQLLRQVEQMDPEDLEKEVYEEFNLILCKSCRDRFVNETQHPWEGPLRMKGGPGTILH